MNYLDTPLISVIVPVYNTEKYLNECIDSILTQTYKNIEIILVDDGSIDSSGSICDSYANKYKNIKVHHQNNGGPSHARNCGLMIATGEYIGFVDSDDYIDKNMYQTMLEIAEGNQADLVMCGINIVIGNKIIPLEMNYESKYPNSNYIKNDLIKRFCMPNHNGLYSSVNKLFKKDVLQFFKIKFDETINYGEDTWFIFDNLKNINVFCFTDKGFYYYRQNENSLMHKENNDYQRHKDYRIRLKTELERINFIYDYNDFYYGFLLNSISYCRYMISKKEKNNVINVLEDSYFKNACKYSKRLPLHYKLICMMERFNLLFFIELLLKILNIKK